jgi:hypothetical protein
MHDFLPGLRALKNQKNFEEELMFCQENRIHTHTTLQRNYFRSAAGVLCSLVMVLFALPAFAQGHLHELYYNDSGWNNVDLTGLTGAPPATYQGGIAAFYTADKPNDQFHVYYVDDTSSHVHQAYFNGASWIDEDLTVSGNGSTAFPFAMSAFNIGNLQYVFYVATTNHVHELYYNNDDWTDTDITASANGSLAYYQGLLALVTKPNNQFHVFYQTQAGAGTHQLYFNGSTWVDENITTLTNGAYCDTDWFVGIAVEHEQHIFCPGHGAFSSNLDMLHIYYNNSSWTYEDVSYLSGLETPMASFNVPVAAFQYPGKVEGEVYAATDDYHVHQFTYNKGWSDLDLTASIGAPEIQTGGAVAFPTTPNDQFHFYYQPSPYTQIEQLYFNGTSWLPEGLAEGTGDVSGDGGMAGFAIGNLQYVFYISEN